MVVGADWTAESAQAGGMLGLGVRAAGLSFVSAPPGCAAAAGAITCRAGALAVGASAAFSVTVEVEAGATGVLTNTAAVAGAGREPDPFDNVASVGVRVLPNYRVYLPLVLRRWSE